MISESLYQKVLIDPPEKYGADELLVVSGYATSAMAFHHIKDLESKDMNVKIHLLVGMCSIEGLINSNHYGFKQIVQEYQDRFNCSYIIKPPPVHSKLYIWRRYKKEIIKIFIGSANYTQLAFSKNQKEIIASIACNDNAIDYFKILEKNSMCCDHIDVENFVTIYPANSYSSRRIHGNSVSNINGNDSNIESVEVSLLNTKGKIHQRAGLNWGQRDNRNPNQAYLQLSQNVYRSDFFPIRGKHFTVVTDDSKTFICTRAQKDENGHAIETPHNNALLGEYFRYRLGLPNGEFVNKSDLEKYGRTSVIFYKFDEENYYMDFDPNNHA